VWSDAFVESLNRAVQPPWPVQEYGRAANACGSRPLPADGTIR
jgi:hypothetical protein